MARTTNCQRGAWAPKRRVRKERWRASFSISGRTVAAEEEEEVVCEEAEEAVVREEDAGAEAPAVEALEAMSHGLSIEKAAVSGSAIDGLALEPGARDLESRPLLARRVHLRK